VNAHLPTSWCDDTMRENGSRTNEKMKYLLMISSGISLRSTQRVAHSSTVGVVEHLIMREVSLLVLKIRFPRPFRPSTLTRVSAVELPAYHIPCTDM